MLPANALFFSSLLFSSLVIMPLPTAVAEESAEFRIQFSFRIRNTGKWVT